MIKITSIQIENLKAYIEKKLDSTPCDHSLRFSKDWTDSNGFDFNNLIDILEENGGFCDCEVVMNLPDNEDLVIDNDSQTVDTENSWKLPKDYVPADKEKHYSKILIATDNCKNNCYAEIGDILIPAPKGAKPKKRTRKSVHYFIGLKSGLPNEYGFVIESNNMTAREFAKQVRDSEQKDLNRFTENEADFYLSRLENLKVDTPVGTHFMEQSGLTGKGEELRIHKIVLRR